MREKIYTGIVKDINYVNNHLSIVRLCDVEEGDINFYFFGVLDHRFKVKLVETRSVEFGGLVKRVLRQRVACSEFEQGLPA